MSRILINKYYGEQNGIWQKDGKSLKEIESDGKSAKEIAQTLL